MKRKLFLPIITILAFIAMVTVISCDKSEPQIVEEDLNGFDAPSGTKYIAESIDRNESQIEGLQVKSGGHYSYDEIQNLAPELYKMLGGDELRRSPNSRAIKSRWVLVKMYKTCTSPCIQLGQELKGQKGTNNWVQIASAPSYDPYVLMLYKYDPKPLYNYDAGTYHYYAHWNYNDAGNIDMMFMLDDPAEGGIWLPDVDNVNIACNGVVTWFKGYSEVAYIPVIKYGWDENAIVYLYSSSTSCN